MVAYPSSTNTFVPDHEASGKLVVDFARNIKNWAVSKYTQLVPVKKTVGFYLRMTIEEAGRIVNTAMENFRWPDGLPAPEGNEGTESFDFLQYRCERYAFPFMLGDLTIDQASWNILAQHASIKARQAMTARTMLAITVLTTAGNYDPTHVSAIAAIPGNSGTLIQSTTARQDIRRSLDYAAEIILDGTLAAVDPDDLIWVINSDLAAKLTQTQEIVDHIKGSPEALAQIRGELPGSNTIYGLPDKIYGFPVVVEKTRRVTTQKGATTARAQILPNATSFMCARPGALVGVADSPNFSTCCIFAAEEMTVETLRDAPNRRTQGRVVENLVPVMTAPVSGFLFTGCQ